MGRASRRFVHFLILRNIFFILQRRKFFWLVLRPNHGEPVRIIVDLWEWKTKQGRFGKNVLKQMMASNYCVDSYATARILRYFAFQKVLVQLTANGF